jgi:hypothetical protein
MHWPLNVDMGVCVCVCVCVAHRVLANVRVDMLVSPGVATATCNDSFGVLMQRAMHAIEWSLWHDSRSMCVMEMQC